MTPPKCGHCNKDMVALKTEWIHNKFIATFKCPGCGDTYKEEIQLDN